MITITRNANFSNWFEIRLFHSLVDQASTEAKALRIAKKIQRKEKANLPISVMTKIENDLT